MKSGGAEQEAGLVVVRERDTGRETHRETHSEYAGKKEISILPRGKTKCGATRLASHVVMLTSTVKLIYWREGHELCIGPPRQLES